MAATGPKNPSHLHPARRASPPPRPGRRLLEAARGRRLRSPMTSGSVVATFRPRPRLSSPACATGAGPALAARAVPTIPVTITGMAQRSAAIRAWVDRRKVCSPTQPRPSSPLEALSTRISLAPLFTAWRSGLITIPGSKLADCPRWPPTAAENRDQLQRQVLLAVVPCRCQSASSGSYHASFRTRPGQRHAPRNYLPAAAPVLVSRARQYCRFAGPPFHPDVGQGSALVPSPTRWHAVSW